nr:venom protein [Lampona murina]
MLRTVCLLICFQLIQGKSLEQLDDNDKRPLCPCGQNEDSLNTRVVGGHVAERTSFPFASALLFATGSRSPFFSAYCGATLITDRHVVTAAHCLRDARKPSHIAVDVGDYSLRDGRNKTIILSRNFAMFPEYHAHSFHTDIGIIELQHPVSFESGIHTVPLPKQGFELKPGTTVIVYGWGRLSYTGDHPDKLNAVELPVVTNEKCQPQFVSEIEPNMLCAGGEEGKDACIGDSGSGLVVRLDNQYVLSGVVSFGRNCALPGVPGVYTKVSSYVNWILEQTKTAGCRPCIYGQDE